MARALMLFEQRRFPDAETELRRYLADFPQHAAAVSLLAVVVSHLGRLDESVDIGAQAVSLAPADGEVMKRYAWLLFRADRRDEAEISVRRALRLNPSDAELYGIMGSLMLEKRDFKGALAQAEAGLRIDPDDSTCANVKSTALVKLKRTAEASFSMQGDLERDPEDPYTHTSVGWSKLELNEPDAALNHFRIALKLDPNFQPAKSGMVEALKARYWFYRLFLRYYFWIGNLSRQWQMGIIFGGYILIQFVAQFGESNPSLKPFTSVIVWAYIAFALSTWVMEPLSNLFLRLNVYGRYALTAAQTQSSNFVGASLGVALVGLVAYFITWNDGFIALLIYGITMMIPLSIAFRKYPGNNQRIVIGAAAAMGIVGAISCFMAISEGEMENGLTMVYLIFLIGIQFGVNFLLTRR